MHQKPYKVGSRGSLLAQRQTHLVLQSLIKRFPYNDRLCGAEGVWIKTSGDKIIDQSLADKGGKALFCKEIQQAVWDKEIDFAVHSLKDLDHKPPPGLLIAAVLEREDCHDVLVTPSNAHRPSLISLEPGSRVGTCAPRRAAQLLYLRPDLEIVPLRGNVPTRLKKLENEGLQAIVLALAGLKRLGICKNTHPHLNFDVLPFDHMLPAAGQGVLAIECREDNEDIKDLLKEINHWQTYTCIQAERTLVRELDGNCYTAIAALATLTPEKQIDLRAVYFPDYPHQTQGRKIVTCQTGPSEEPIQLGQKAAALLK